jgi:hypothetical protein
MFCASNPQEFLIRRSRSILITIFVILFFAFNLTSTKADTLDVISVDATFAAGTANQVTNPTPDFYLTGSFTLDSSATSATITSFDMVLTPVGGAPYDFSSGTGIALLCSYCGTPQSPFFWRFYFSDSNAAISLPTIYTNLPLATGETYYLGAGATTYSDGRFVYPWGQASASASFGGSTGWTYGEDLGDVLTSGFVYVDSSNAVPEPSEFTLLVVGIVTLLGLCYWRHRNLLATSH